MRVSIAVVDRNPVHSRLSVWVNGGLITAPGGICLRNEEVDEFMARLNCPVTSDREKAAGRAAECRLALDELVSAVDDARRRSAAGDDRALESNMLSATMRQAEAELAKGTRPPRS